MNLGFELISKFQDFCRKLAPLLAIVFLLMLSVVSILKSLGLATFLNSFIGANGPFLLASGFGLLGAFTVGMSKAIADNTEALAVVSKSISAVQDIPAPGHCYGPTQWPRIWPLLTVVDSKFLAVNFLTPDAWDRGNGLLFVYSLGGVIKHHRALDRAVDIRRLFVVNDRELGIVKTHAELYRKIINAHSECGLPCKVMHEDHFEKIVISFQKTEDRPLPKCMHTHGFTISDLNFSSQFPHDVAIMLYEYDKTVGEDDKTESRKFRSAQAVDADDINAFSYYSALFDKLWDSSHACSWDKFDESQKPKRLGA